MTFKIIITWASIVDLFWKPINNTKPIIHLKMKMKLIVIQSWLLEVGESYFNCVGAIIPQKNKYIHAFNIPLVFIMIWKLENYDVTKHKCTWQWNFCRHFFSKAQLYFINFVVTEFGMLCFFICITSIVHAPVFATVFCLRVDSD